MPTKGVEGFYVVIGFLIFLINAFILIPLAVLSIPMESVTARYVTAIAINAVLLFLFYKFLPITTRHIILGKGDRIIKDLLIGFVLCMLAYPLVLLWMKLVEEFIVIPPTEQVAVHYLRHALGSPLGTAITLPLMLIVVPITEEFLFRGLLQSWLKTRCGWKFAILLTSIVFAMFHFSTSQNWGNVEIVSGLFLISCLMGWIYERRNSLWAPIGVHITFNTIGTLLVYLTE